MSQRDYFEKDYYATLGVDSDASSSEVSKAYRALARKLHPDANPDDAEAESRFKEVSEAYSVLSNAEKRKEYDQVREMVSSGAFRGGFDGGGGPYAAPGGGFGGGATTFDINDLFGSVFGDAAGGPGRTRTQAGPQRGRDMNAELTLDFADAMAGVTTTMRVSGRASCSTCHGSGARPGTSPVTCSNCGGAGQTVRDHGPFAFAEPCMQCGGTGQQIPDPCPTCSGTGAETRTREVKARIPAGVRDGAKVRIKGKGEAGLRGGPPGDLFVHVRVNSHALFGRRGDHLTLTVPVTFAEAAMGTKITVPTMNEPVTLKVPAGTQTHKTFRIRGKGVPTGKGDRRGDLLVTVDVQVPEKLTRTQRRLLSDYAATEDPSEIRSHIVAAVEVAEGVHDSAQAAGGGVR